MTLSYTHVVHDIRPTLERNALKDGQHRQSEVVEVGDAEVGTDPVEVAHLAEVGLALVTLAARSRRFSCYLACRRQDHTQRR